jgi:C-terminal processing protease CtpA/Prc
VDLTRLTTAEVDAMFERFKETKAIILDVRGYPKGTAWVIAPRLNTRNARDGAMYLQPLVSASDEDARKTFFQMIPATDKWRYTGRTVMLMDERTASQAEHTGLFFEAANGTKFIGSHTAGAKGDVTTFTLPGGIVFYFTGHDVRHADGRQLQRIGLVPDVEVKPTIAGIRSGRDEVLERATQYLREPERARQSKGE